MRNEARQEARKGSGDESARPREDRLPYVKPRVRSSEAFERAASGCGRAGASLPLCNSTS